MYTRFLRQRSSPWWKLRKVPEIVVFPSDSFLFDSLDQNSPTFATRHSKVIVSLNAVILKNVILIPHFKEKEKVFTFDIQDPGLLTG